MRWTHGALERGIEPAAPDAGLRVERTRVGGGRSTGSLLAAVAIAAMLGAAILKPWAPSVDAPAALPSSGSAHAGSPSAVPRIVRPAGSLDPTGIESALRAIHVADWPRLAAAGDLGGQPIVTDRDLGGTHGDGTCGGSARVSPFDELIAVAAPPGERIAAVRLFAIDSIRRPDVPTRLQADRPGPLDGRATDGLTLVGLPSGGIAARQYALIADTTTPTGPGRLIYTICVG
jgi:hypothetical protein